MTADDRPYYVGLALTFILICLSHYLTISDVALGVFGSVVLGRSGFHAWSNASIAKGNQ